MRLLHDSGRFFRTLWSGRKVIAGLARREILSQHGGTYLGVLWVYIHPLAYVFIVYLVFTFGLRSNPGGDVPFVVFLVCGMIAWQFIAACLGSLTRVVRSYNFLVKKGDLSLGVLHVARLAATALPHLALIAACVIVAWLSGLPPTLYTLQVFYYLAAATLLLLGLGWITSSTSLFVEDVANVVQLLVQFGFWLTPIIWNIRKIPVRWRWLFRLNPACYIVDGYRDSLIYQVPFWSRPAETAYFWVFTLAALVAGAAIFRRLKPHFGEVI